MIKIIDGAFSPEIVKEIHTAVEGGQYTPKQKAFAESPIRRMSMHIPLDHEIVTTIMEVVKANIFEPEMYDLVEVYINANTMADAPLSHMDSREDQDITALYYANSEWDMDYGGETVFFDLTTGDITKAVIPLPGRLLLFTSTIRHAARIQNRIAPTFRYTIAFKLKYRKEEEVSESPQN